MIGRKNEKREERDREKEEQLKSLAQETKRRRRVGLEEEKRSERE